jgi:hypothetical protein
MVGRPPILPMGVNSSVSAVLKKRVFWTVDNFSTRILESTLVS